VLSPLGFAAYIALGVVFFSTAGVGIWSGITRDTMDRVLVGWIAGQLLVLVPYFMGLLGGLLIAQVLLHTAARTWAIAAIVLSIVAMAGTAAYSALMIAAAGFTGEQMSGNPLALLATGPVVQFWSDPASWASVALVAASFRLVRVRARLAGVLAIVAALGAVMAVITGSVPPFALAFLWCALGVGWLSAGRKAE